MDRQPRPDPPIQPIGRHSIALCECGQPAVWLCWLVTGKSAKPSPFALCDHCLALELDPHHDDPPHTLASNRDASA